MCTKNYLYETNEVMSTEITNAKLFLISLDETTSQL